MTNFIRDTHVRELTTAHSIAFDLPHESGLIAYDTRGLSRSAEPTVCSRALHAAPVDRRLRIVEKKKKRLSCVFVNGRWGSGESLVARYRLRFLLQEFDLPKGVTILGRSSDCQVTIEDPLVSRHHAQIVLDGNRAIVSDLGSRNGIKINGAPAKQPTELEDGDRLRIGTQELVFCKVESAAHPSTKTTGFLRHCACCRMPYPQEVGECPNCGATEALNENTLSGSFGATAQHTWSVQLFIEVLDRALSLARHEDAHRILRRATVTIEEHLHGGDQVDREQLAKLALGAVRASIAMHEPTWGLWVVQVYRRVPFMMSEDVAIKLGEIVKSFPSDLAKSVEQLAAHLSTLPAEEDGPARVAFERVRASVQPFIEDATKPG